MLQASIDHAVRWAPAIDWSISIRDSAGCELYARNADKSMQIASVGKLLLLVEVARQCAAGDLRGTEMLSRDRELQVADSGLWQHLRVAELCVEDLCVLVAGVSDNLATNVLLKHIGFQRLRTLAGSLGFAGTAILDYVRDYRGPDDAVTFSTGSASELSRLMSQLHHAELLTRAVSERVNGWLATGVDLSMVASAFGLDPLSHATAERDFVVRNKTGADARIRADVGTVGRTDLWLSYAVIANWQSPQPGLPDAALAGMRAIGEILRTTIEDSPA